MRAHDGAQHAGRIEAVVDAPAVDERVVGADDERLGHARGPEVRGEVADGVEEQRERERVLVAVRASGRCRQRRIREHAVELDVRRGRTARELVQLRRVARRDRARRLEEHQHDGRERAFHAEPMDPSVDVDRAHADDARRRGRAVLAG